MKIDIEIAGEEVERSGEKPRRDAIGTGGRDWNAFGEEGKRAYCLPPREGEDSSELVYPSERDWKGKGYII